MRKFTFSSFSQLLLGRPLKSTELSHERLPKWKALPIFSSDALSSIGYGPEQIALVLVLPGLILYNYFPWIIAAIVALLFIITISYAQVIKVHPQGGGAYSIAKEYLGEYPALLAAASLCADYVLTVAVSVSSG
ncbi:MAG: APC family permease, partial [Negativicoccus succinicivorans]|nr:APC family permease [Negativicoccus succinicivorans]